FFSSRRRHTRSLRDWSSDVCSSDLAIWDGSTLTLYEESQPIFNMRGLLAQMFGLPKENVRVITKFVGSGFGSKLWPWTHCPLASSEERRVGKECRCRWWT